MQSTQEYDFDSLAKRVQLAFCNRRVEVKQS